MFADRYAHAHGKAVFHPIDEFVSAEGIDATYPYVLSTGRVMMHYLTGVQTRRTKVLSEKSPEPYVEIHPQTAAEHAVRTGDVVELDSAYGTARYRKYCPVALRKIPSEETFQDEQAQVGTCR